LSIEVAELRVIYELVQKISLAICHVGIHRGVGF
jgi:hypothetical protein